MRKTLLFVFIWIFVIHVFALLANNRLNLLPDTAYGWINPEFTFQVKDWNILNIHSRWDTYWYMDIAKNGYSYLGSDQLSNIVFFPLYPFLVKSIGGLLDISYLFVGVIISLTATVISCVYLFKLVSEFHKKADAFMTVVYFLLFPTAFFLTAFYTESLFIMFTIMFFFFLLKKNYWLSVSLGLAASLTRFTGVLLFVPMLIEVMRSKKGIQIREFLPIFLIPLGTAAFFLFHYVRFGDILLFFKVQALWGRGFVFNQEHFGLLTSAALANFIMDALFTIFAFISSLLIAKKLRLSYGVYMLLTVLVPLSSGTTVSIGRYVLTLFPIFIYSSMNKSEVFKQSWLMISSLFLALYTLLYVAHYWAG